jgi:hypothetical protein
MTDNPSTQSVNPAARDMPSFTRREFIKWGLIIELGTLAIAVGLAFLSGEHFWKEIRFDATDALIGCLAALPLMIVFFFARQLGELVRKLLGPALAESSLAELLLIALLAGICEEALFRGVLEPWVHRLHWFVGFFGVNLLFGALHAVTRNYFFLATGFGMFLSLLNWGIGEPNLLRSIACHVVYDFLAFLWLARLHRSKQVRIYFG